MTDGQARQRQLYIDQTSCLHAELEQGWQMGTSHGDSQDWSSVTLCGDLRLRIGVEMTQAVVIPGYYA